MPERFRKGRKEHVADGSKTGLPIYHIKSRHCRGAAGSVIAGTRITVNCIAAYYQLGMSVDEILDSLRHLTPSQIHSALAYYFDHMDEINVELEEAGNSEYWKSQVQTHPALQ